MKGVAKADVISSFGKYGETEFQVNKIAEDELKIVATLLTNVISSFGKYGETEFQVNKIAEDELKIIATSFLESGRSPRKMRPC